MLSTTFLLCVRLMGSFSYAFYELLICLFVRPSKTNGKRRDREKASRRQRAKRQKKTNQKNRRRVLDIHNKLSADGIARLDCSIAHVGHRWRTKEGRDQRNKQTHKKLGRRREMASNKTRQTTTAARACCLLVKSMSSWEGRKSLDPKHFPEKLSQRRTKQKKRDDCYVISLLLLL